MVNIFYIDIVSRGLVKGIAVRAAFMAAPAATGGGSDPDCGYGGVLTTLSCNLASSPY
jgi:hypothetical protein